MSTLTALPQPVPAAEPAPTAAPAPARRRRLADRLDLAAALLPAALVLFFAFQAGGFFPGATGFAAAALAVAVALRALVAERPFASLGAPVAVAGSALAALAVWQLVSVGWSSAPGRALADFDRTLLYALAFLLCASFEWSPKRLAWALRALALAVVAVCVAGWATRVAPDLFTISQSRGTERLAFPLTYWNAQGLVAAMGIVLCVHLSSAAREPAWVRVLGAAAVPVLASTLFLTLSRGAAVAAVAGLVAYVVLYRSRGLLTGLLAALPPGALAVALSYDADLLTTEQARSAAAAVQGHELAAAVGLCCAAALAVRALAAWLVDRRLQALAVPGWARAVVTAGIVLAVAGGAPALDAPARAERQVDGFLHKQDATAAEQRDRFLDPANTGRVDHWQVALDLFREAPVKGTGAGTYEVHWYERREIDLRVSDAHSLYLEVLAELGVVGLALLLVALLGIAGAVAWRGRRRGPFGVDPALTAVLGALFVCWGLQAGIDWMWELPAVTVGLFCLAGFALAGRARHAPGRTLRVAVALGVLVLAVVPFQMAQSQGELEGSLRAFHSTQPDCPKAIDGALASLERIPGRPEPWEVIAYCNVGEGQPALAVQAARNAVARDPGRWTYHYALALVQGIAGQDPRPAARRALALNPRSGLAKRAVRRFSAAKPSRWATVSRRLELPRD